MRKTLLIVLVTLAATVIAQTPAAAVAPAWMLDGKTLTEEGLTTTAVKTTAKTDENSTLIAGSLTLTCSGNVEGTSPTIHENDVSSANSLILTACKAIPATCTVPTTIGTVPLSLEGTLDGSLATKGIIKPTSGSAFTTILIAGAECAAAGSKAITGDFEILSPEGQDERTDQLEDTVQGASGLLKFGSSSASLKGAVLVLLANNAAWSFL